MERFPEPLLAKFLEAIESQLAFAHKRLSECKLKGQENSVREWGSYIAALEWAIRWHKFETGEYHYPGNWPFCSPPQFPVQLFPKQVVEAEQCHEQGQVT